MLKIKLFVKVLVNYHGQIIQDEIKYEKYNKREIQI